ncbi:MAG: hypothetical protein F6K39_18830 [Okeania sp. SIO3B3]|nr:hypothetical protein [Okeania sp. SIO3B3]
MPEIFSFCEVPTDICLFLPKSFHPFLPSEKLPTFSFSEAQVKDFHKFSPGAMPEIFSFCEVPTDIYLFLPKSFHPFLTSEKLPTFLFSEAQEKFRASKDFHKFSPGAMPEIFSFCEVPTDIYLFLPKSFHPFLTSEKLPTFSFSEAQEKFRASKDF